MSKGAIIATGFWGVVVALIAYGYWCDPVSGWLRRWNDRRLERRAGRWLAAMDEIDRGEIEARCEQTLGPAQTRSATGPSVRRALPPHQVAELDRHFNLPAAPNPKWRVL